jgi:hypothetical protein
MDAWLHAVRLCSIDWKRLGVNKCEIERTREIQARCRVERRLWATANDDRSLLRVTLEDAALVQPRAHPATCSSMRVSMTPEHESEHCTHTHTHTHTQGLQKSCHASPSARAARRVSRGQTFLSFDALRRAASAASVRGSPLSPGGPPPPPSADIRAVARLSLRLFHTLPFWF